MVDAVDLHQFLTVCSGLYVIKRSAERRRSGRNRQHDAGL
jgi:hypothetical protein